MSQFKIMTDSSCDLPQELVEKLELTVVPLSVHIEEKTYLNYPDGRELDTKEFYSMLRKGVMAKTSAVNAHAFAQIMEEEVKQGTDLLYIGFSSALSATVTFAEVAAKELREKYPERKIIVVDSLCASLGQGLLIYLAAKEKAAGRTIEEVAEFAEKIKLNICHWFTVDDLQHLKRGGRIPAVTAIVGSALQIKPVLHVSDEGKLENVSKARGRKASIKVLIKKIVETSTDIKKQTVFISHGDCEEEVLTIAKTLKEEYGIPEVIINPVGPVIGAHSGPGTIAVFFVGPVR